MIDLALLIIVGAAGNKYPTLLFLIVEGRGRIKLKNLGKNPQVHLIIIRE